MYLRGVNSRTRSFALCGAAVAVVATVLAAVGSAATSDDAATGAAKSTPANQTVIVAGSAVARPPEGTVTPAATAAPRMRIVDEPAPVPTGVPTTSVPPVSPAPSGPLLVARYSFDSGGRIVADLSGHGHTLRTRSGHGGRTRYIRHLPGRAVAFPKKCAGKTCARVVLQAAHTPRLNPGTKPFAFGATVKLSRKQTTRGQNVVQKGFATRGSQYKLQIDGSAGKPSCALVGRNKPRIRLVKSSVSVADDTWHRIECRRAGTAWTISVDGVVRGTVTVPARLAVSNTSPLSLGGKGGYQNNDQFQGAFDDVWVGIG